MCGGTVILAAGDFPRKGGAAWTLLANATRVVCCDGATEMYCRRMGKEPFAIVGDLDSLKRRTFASARLVRIAEQESNDLAKAVRWCRSQGWKKPVILGATGKREDHTIGNLFRALDFGLEVVTDAGRFIPVSGATRLRTTPGRPVSIFAPDRTTRMTSKGLEWPLDTVVFDTLYCATLNRTTASTITLTTTAPVLVFLASESSS